MSDNILEETINIQVYCRKFDVRKYEYSNRYGDSFLNEMESILAHIYLLIVFQLRNEKNTSQAQESSATRNLLVTRSNDVIR